MNSQPFAYYSTFNHNNHALDSLDLDLVCSNFPRKSWDEDETLRDNLIFPKGFTLWIHGRPVMCREEHIALDPFGTVDTMRTVDSLPTKGKKDEERTCYR